VAATPRQRALFAQRLIDWQAAHGRHDLPWQQTRDPYRVWLAEIMLQQTQVVTVIGYYARFLARFPTLASLAAAPVEAVMEGWSGLGYYARARNLHACAQQVMQRYGGKFPADPAEMAGLPGIGRSTANAIAAVCFSARVPILDGNVKRLLCRVCGLAGYPGTPAVASRLWQVAADLLPTAAVAAYIQAQMDMGATICTRNKPRCTGCPVVDLCVAHREGTVAALPTPRPKKPVPERTVTLLVLCADARVLLEKRPAAGIWGGLLSLPELPDALDAADGAAVAAYCAQRLGVAIDAVMPAPTFCHTFTHFRLQIRPLVCTASAGAPPVAPPLRWVATAPGELARAALPAPIRKILSAIP
jgi:A/G-specific adenine glycosylase